MVNEVNKPSSDTLENDALRARMESSNRNIERMQQEHQELLREMATLRQTAAELALNSAQHIPSIDRSLSSTTAATAASTEEASVNLSQQVSSAVETTTATCEVKTEASSSTSRANSAPEVDHNTSTTEAEDSDESAKYIREKIAEIAAMKAQFKRVQHMVNTTNMIEEHVARDPLEQIPAQSPRTIRAEPPSIEDDEIDSTLTDFNADRAAPTGVTSTQENVELLMDLLSVFDEFKNDLREQASSLRAERDRLRTLKEEILRRRNQ